MARQIENWIVSKSIKKTTFRTPEQLKQQVAGLVKIQGPDGFYYVRPEQVEAKLEKFRKQAEAAGKDPKRVVVCKSA